MAPLSQTVPEALVKYPFQVDGFVGLIEPEKSRLHASSKSMETPA